MTTRPKKPEAKEVATTGDGRDITEGWVGPLKRTTDTILAARGSSLEIYEKVLQDDQVFSCLQQRRLAVISKEWQVDPGADDALSIKAADSLRAQLAAIRFDQITNLMLYGTFYGYAVGECMFGQDGREWLLTDVKVRKARRFAYDQEGGLRLLTRDNRVPGELMPPNKFWTYSVGADNDDAPYGQGLGHWCYWPAWFKRNGIKFWAIFLDKYGMPTAKGTYPRGASDDEKRKLLQALRAIQTDSGVIVPDGMMIDLVQATRASGGDYNVFVKMMDAAIAKVILSQTATTEAVSGKLGSDQEHMEVRDEVAKADADLLCASFNQGPVRWLTDWNYPGAVPPRVYRNFEKAEDLAKIATRDKTIYDMGFEPSEEYIKATYGDGWAKKALTPAYKPGQTPPDFAEGPAPVDGLTAGAALLEEGWQEDTGPILAQIEKVAAASTDFQDFQRRLTELWPSLDTAAMQERIARFTFQARLGGLAGDGIRPGMDMPDP